MAKNGYASDTANGSGTQTEAELYGSSGRYSKNNSNATIAQSIARRRGDRFRVSNVKPRPANTAKKTRAKSSERIGQRTAENHSNSPPGSGIQFAYGTERIFLK
jgi:hypothetical protein